MTVTINGTTGIAGVDGSAATPAVQGVDTNTGVFYGTDIVAISTGGTERVRVTSTGVNLNGSTSGTLTIAAPAVAGTNTLTLVAATETLAPLISGTSQASTSGTSIDFTGIPSWVKRITVMLSGVSLSTTASTVAVRIGSGSFETTGYVGGFGLSTSAAGANAFASDQYITLAAPTAIADTMHGALVITNVSGNLWVAQGSFFRDSASTDAGYMVAASKTTSGVLDRVQVTLTSTGAFDAGTINIMYE